MTRLPTFANAIMLLLAIAASSTAMASEQARGFAAGSATIIKDLRAQGLERVGKLELSKLQKEIESTRWKTSSVFFAGSGEDRVTAINLPRERTVIVNEPSLNLISDEISEQVALHETLGANGYEDENYEKTLSLDLLRSEKTFGREAMRSQLNEMNKESLKASQNRVYKNRRGGTSVGGGGDGTALEFKRRLLLLAQVELAQLSTTAKAEALFTFILRSEVEPNWNLDEQRSEMAFDGTGLRLSIPSVFWFAWSQQPSPSNEKETYVRDAFEKVVVLLNSKGPNSKGQLP